ncbi:AraC family transcriptional regulator [Actinopolymorpha alba]|uniref:AraC family transcriptional regulator n=1 Tax=Actinopolymorpha alba TaxID=533267 RepID=UPI000367F142|nr:AraC family transcriptional regulator [Actinopolymorpha alba]
MSAGQPPAPIYRERELFRAAAFPLFANVATLAGDSEIHSHDFLEIAVVGAGTGTHVCAHGATSVSAGQVFVLRPGTWHGFAGCRGLVVANTCLSPSTLLRDVAFLREEPEVSDLLWSGPLAPHCQGVLAVEISALAAREAVASISVLERRIAERPHDRVLLLGQLLTVLGQLVAGLPAAGSTGPHPHEPRGPHPAVSEAAGRLDAAPEHPWQVEEIARLVSLDPAYLSRLFRRDLGVPPIAYLARLRAEKAAGLLAGGTTPVARVGALVGWPDPTYFARRFRTLVGLTPSEYRRRLRPTAEPDT